VRELYIPTAEEIATLDPFYAAFPNTTLLKGEEQGSRWMVYLEASNESRDQEEDVTVMKALKDASDFYLTHGVISWDHQHKLQKDPEFIIGEPVDIAFTETHSTLIKGLLYKENRKAQGVMGNLLSKTSRFGSSIGGYILKKALESAGKFIRKVIWDDTAITYKPVNDTTLGKVQLVPFAEFAKALTAGTGVDASTFSGGRALTPESLRGKTVNMLFKDFLVKVKGGELGTYEKIRAWVKSHDLTEEVGDAIMDFIFAMITKKAS